MISTVCFSDTDMSYIFFAGSMEKPYRSQISLILAEAAFRSSLRSPSSPRTMFSAAVNTSTSLKC